MRVPVPYLLGEYAQKEKKHFVGVSWFPWSSGMEFTYFFRPEGKWKTSDIIVEKEPEYRLGYEIDDALLQDGFLKEKGFPIKGRGYVSGFSYVDGEITADVILKDKYFSHIYIACTENGHYKENGKVYVPPSWDTEERMYSIILEKYKNICVESRFV